MQSVHNVERLPEEEEEGEEEEEEEEEEECCDRGGSSRTKIAQQQPQLHTGFQSVILEPFLCNVVLMIDRQSQPHTGSFAVGFTAENDF